MKGFKEFLLQTNALALAIGVIIGGAVGKVVGSLVKDILMPPLGLILGKVDFSSLFINLGGSYATLAEAQAAGAPTLNIGLFFNAIVDFVIIAFCIYMIVKLFEKKEAPPPATKDCPDCLEALKPEVKVCKFCGHKFA